MVALIKGKGHLFKIIKGGVHISTLGGLWSISCRQYLDPTSGKFCPIYGPHLEGNVIVDFIILLVLKYQLHGFEINEDLHDCVGISLGTPVGGLKTCDKMVNTAFYMFY